ncbi:2Fe-2S iron-sulfur cluster binding domain-containing protein [Acetobacter musti]|uniref:2Fe-2S iron-sulfur cluster binding domain-containing protein n=1 Tax=Acetobacter musti TaxID=864732 RepID=A0ABX0JU58_9PROT|nr:2Fe-2S iron-sulfur cluster binding domain-containing protein [Acetobacter musti]
MTLIVNATRTSLTVDNSTTLLDLLRERLELTGAKKGCDHGQCGTGPASPCNTKSRSTHPRERSKWRKV